jgi:hypothetical protein
MSAISYYGRRIKRNREELDYLKSVNVKSICNIAEARDKGICLKMQNDAAKEAQGMLEMKLQARRSTF